MTKPIEENPAYANPLSLFDVSGDAILITGASGALGRAVALALGSLGARLMLASGSEDGLRCVHDEVRRLGGTAETLVGRPDTLPDTDAMIAATVSAYGRCDSVFVGSGLNKPAPIEAMPVSDFDAVMNANVRGPWLLAKSFGDHVATRDGGGRMVLVSSVRGRHGNVAGYSAYCTSKGATDALTRTLATEWGQRGINVNAIAPAVFRSGLTEWIFADTPAGKSARDRNYLRIPMKRLGEAEDFVGIAIYLLSPASAFVTGQIVYVDGGYTAS